MIQLLWFGVILAENLILFTLKKLKVAEKYPSNVYVETQLRKNKIRYFQSSQYLKY